MPKASWITAHSGCDGRADNSIEFVEYALSLELDCVEVDVRRNGEGELVMAHNADSPAAPRREAFALLREAPGKKMNCDLKTRRLEAQVLELARSEGVGDRLVYSGDVSGDWMAENPGAAMWFMNIELCCPALYENPALAVEEASARELADRVTAEAKRCGAACVNLHYRLYDTALCRILREEGLPLSLWTPSEKEEVERFLDEGVYNITTRIAGFASDRRRSAT